MTRLPLRLVTATSLFALGSTVALAQPVARPVPAAGSVVAAKGGEELRFVREDAWRGVALQQDLVGGDAVRTNSIGNLAILFVDQTQIRVGRNSTLVVNEVASRQGDTKLELQSGTVWARAARGGSGVDVKTPAAVAAIRGTDWSLSVDASGKTSLVVLEGVVELKNAQGAVIVRQGEGAVAAIGQAPTKFVLVNSNDREQMLFYLSLRDAFLALPATPERGPALRAERARIAAIPPGARRAEEWLALAEAAMSLDGQKAAAAALVEAQRHRLSAAQRARADLIAGLLAGSERRWSDAAALFARAERGLQGRRRVSAAYGGYIARSLADPKRVQAEPALKSDDPLAAMAHAYILGFRQDLNAAADAAKAAEKRFPNDAQVAAFSAQLALSLNRREDMRASVARALALDPQDPDVLLASASAKAFIDSDIDGALNDLRKASAIAPGQAAIWAGIGLLESERDAPLEAEAAYRRALDNDPNDPVAHANLALHYLEQERLAEANLLLEKALALDPSFHVGHVARGQLLLQQGETAKAIEEMLIGTTANPAFANGLFAQAVAYFQNGEQELAAQALDNADRLDPNDPLVAIGRTAIALDALEADKAILGARESLRRFRNRGGYYAPLAVNRRGGSFVAQAYRLIDLNEWARFYGDRTFDPFTGASYFDQAAARRPKLITERPTIDAVQGNDADLTAFNLSLQGLFFDPLAVSGRVGRIDLLRRPFLDGEVGGGVVSRGGKVGWETSGTIQGYANSFVPTAFSLSAGRVRANGDTPVDKEQADIASFFVGMQPTAADRFFAFGTASNAQPGFAVQEVATAARYADEETTALVGGAGWSHSFGFRNVVNVGVFGTRAFNDQTQRELQLDLQRLLLIDTTLFQKTRTDGVSASLNHSIGFGDFTARYGFDAQAGRSATDLSTVQSVRTFNGQTFSDRLDGSDSQPFRAGRAFADLFWRPSDRFEAQAGLQHNVVDLGAGSDADHDVNPRVGFGVSPFEGQWLRAAYRKDSALPVSFTLAPITTAGLVPNELPVALGGRWQTLALRWDAEWTPRFFTSVEYQRQEARALNVPIVNTLDTFGIDKAQVDWVAATANLWLGSGIGVFGTVGTADTEIVAGEGAGFDVPFIPRNFARAGITFVHPSRLRITLAETYIGERAGTRGTFVLDDYWTTDGSISWETPDRRLLVSATALNLFDTEYRLSPLVSGTGRTFAASLKARF
jgi:tetratricopeptide (TPR) repeat protein